MHTVTLGADDRAVRIRSGNQTSGACRVARRGLSHGNGRWETFSPTQGMPLRSLASGTLAIPTVAGPPITDSTIDRLTKSIDTSVGRTCKLEFFQRP